VRTASHATEVVRLIYDINDSVPAGEFVDQLVIDLQIQTLGRPLARWRDQIVLRHGAHVSIGSTEAMNNLIEDQTSRLQVPPFANSRIRVLLYADRPNWDLLAKSDPLRSEKPDIWRPRCGSDRRPTALLSE